MERGNVAYILRVLVRVYRVYIGCKFTGERWNLLSRGINYLLISFTGLRDVQFDHLPVCSNVPKANFLVLRFLFEVPTTCLSGLV